MTGSHPFSRRWRWTTLAVLAACVGFVLLGSWQLQRLEARRQFNISMAQRAAQPPLVLPPSGPGLDQFDAGGPTGQPHLYGRAVLVRGTFDHAQDVALGNQVWIGRPGENGGFAPVSQIGLHLITPLIVEGTGRAVLVDRGWIPAAQDDPSDWAAYHTTGRVEITGRIRLGQPAGGAAPPRPSPNERIIPRLDVGRLQYQIAHRLLPFVVVQSPEPGRTDLPYRKELVLDTGEGVHLIAAVQWFAFAAILATGYAVYVRRH